MTIGGLKQIICTLERKISLRELMRLIASIKNKQDQVTCTHAACIKVMEITIRAPKTLQDCTSYR